MLVQLLIVYALCEFSFYSKLNQFDKFYENNIFFFFYENLWDAEYNYLLWFEDLPIGCWTAEFSIMLIHSSKTKKK